MSVDLDFEGLEEAVPQSGECIVLPLLCPDCPPPMHRYAQTCYGCAMVCEAKARMMATPKGHQIWHDTYLCRNCGAPEWNWERRRNCYLKQCVIMICFKCGYRICSWGAIACPCDGHRIRTLPKLSRRSSRRWRKHG